MRAIAAFALALLVGWASASGNPPEPQRQQVVPAQQQQPARTNKPAEPDTRGSKELPLVVVIPKSQAEAANEQKESTERTDYYRDAHVLGWATFWILIVQAIVFGVQAWRLQQSVEEMRSTTNAVKGLAALQRPWLILEEPTVVWSEVVGRPPIPRLTYRIANGGLGPAFIFESGHVFRYLEVPNLPKEPFYERTKAWDGHPVSSDGHINRSVVMKDGPIDVEARVRGNGYVFHGFVKYKDSGGGVHETRFCARWCLPETFAEPIFQDFGTSEYKKHT